MTALSQHNKSPKETPATKTFITQADIDNALAMVDPDGPYALGSSYDELLKDTMNLAHGVEIHLDTTAGAKSWHHVSAKKTSLHSDRAFNLIHYRGQDIKVVNKGAKGFYVYVGHRTEGKFHPRGRFWVVTGGSYTL
jgi:hypothetical protein